MTAGRVVKKHESRRHVLEGYDKKQTHELFSNHKSVMLEQTPRFTEEAKQPSFAFKTQDDAKLYNAIVTGSHEKSIAWLLK